MADKSCCVDSPAGVRINGSLPGGGVSGGGVIGGGAPGVGVVNKLAAALDAAVHGDGSGGASGSASGNGGGRIIQFPLVNPYRPLKAVRSPISGLNAFPKVSDIVNFGYRVDRAAVFNNRGVDTNDQLPEGSESLGFTFQEYPDGVSLPSSGPSNLQLILDTIARTLPATISAAKKQPYYDPAARGYSQTGYETGGAYPGQAGGQIGSQVGGAVGNVGDTLGNIVAQHPYLVLAGGAALVLLFMSPPRRR
jgi:hypothetical protein